MTNHPLKNWRLTRGWTQTKLGNAIGVTKGAVSKYENGVAPEWAKQLAIYELTNGAVMPNDWLPKEEAAE